MSAYSVPDAEPLDRLWRTVRDMFLDPSIRFGQPALEPWSETARRQDAARSELNKLLADTESRLYFVNSRGVQELHGPTLFTSDQINRHATLVTGVYISFEMPGPNKEYLDQKLWITNNDSDVIVKRIAATLRVNSAGTAASAVQSTKAAEIQCADWLRGALADPSRANDNKASFEKDALAQFENRLSKIGFKRVWDAVASPERKSSGRKPKGNRLAN